MGPHSGGGKRFLVKITIYYLEEGKAKLLWQLQDNKVETAEEYYEERKEVYSGMLEVFFVLKGQISDHQIEESLV